MPHHHDFGTAANNAGVEESIASSIAFVTENSVNDLTTLGIKSLEH